MDANKVLLGTNGKAWVNGELLANVKSMEAKLSADYEDIKFAGNYGTSSAYKGYSIEGTMVLHKMDSKIAKIIADGYITGNVPDVTIVTGVDQPSVGMEKVQLSGVKFTELTLSKWEVGEVGEEEVPFRAESYKYLEQI